MKKIIFAFLILFSTNIISSQSLISKFYCQILGNKDASLENKEMVYRALKKLGIKNVEDVSVKQMNGVGPAFARLPLSSFTAFGIWLDEDYLSKCSPIERVFHIYHEAAHYAKKHHQKILAGAAIMLPAIAIALIKLNQLVADPIYKYGAMSGVSLSALLGNYFYVLPKINKTHEKEADLLAAKILISSGNEKIVDYYIEELKKYNPNSENIWWYSIGQQIKYLQELK
ncbi:hypothetical protein M1446_05475 [Candidatus Dependentiae bacterium]|nr:hypothetical protein [Candidatus Dependentiae bacterium]